LAAVDALSALHRTALDGLTPFTVADDCAVLRRWHAALTLADPRSAEHTHGLLNALLQRAAQLPPARPCTIHRDFYARQVLISARATTLVDFDTLAQGDPGVDLGNLMAHALFDQLAAGARLESLPAIGSGWLERYEHLNQRIDQRSLAFYTASALFRVGAVHALRSATRRHAPALWQLAAMKISHPTRSPLATALGRMEQHDALSH
jgi:aminoglycoside phosphotransferase (APT) family kinase protein